MLLLLLPLDLHFSFSHFKRRHQCASLLERVKKRNMTGSWPAFRCSNAICGSINGGPSVCRQMQTVGETSERAAWPLQKSLNSIKHIDVCGVECDCNQSWEGCTWTYFFSISVVLSFAFILQWTSKIGLFFQEIYDASAKPVVFLL